MARRAQGYKLRNKDGIWTVRFRIDKRQQELSTGIKAEPPTAKRPSEAAEAEGRRIYAEALSGRRTQRQRSSVAALVDDAQPLTELVADWAGQLAVREVTRAQYEMYGVLWCGTWATTAELSDAAISTHITGRLREVLRKSVLNEASALRNFCKWLQETNVTPTLLIVPTVSKSLSGRKYHTRRRVRAPELSPLEIEKLLAALPLKSRWGHAVRARFVLMFDTTLRPTTLDKLSVPENWARGEVVLRVRDDDDKESFGREVPLTDRAVEALTSAAPDVGLIFGKHKYNHYLTKAAAAVLPPTKAAIFTGQHIRSVAITRYLELSSNLAGVQGLAGHKHAATTSRYVRTSFRASLAVVAPFIRGSQSREAANDEGFSADLVAPTQGLEPWTRRLTAACSTN